MYFHDLIHEYYCDNEIVHRVHKDIPGDHRILQYHFIRHEGKGCNPCEKLSSPINQNARQAKSLFTSLATDQYILLAKGPVTAKSCGSMLVTGCHVYRTDVLIADRKECRRKKKQEQWLFYNLIVCDSPVLDAYLFVLLPFGNVLFLSAPERLLSWPAPITLSQLFNPKTKQKREPWQIIQEDFVYGVALDETQKKELVSVLKKSILCWS